MGNVRESAPVTNNKLLLCNAIDDRNMKTENIKIIAQKKLFQYVGIFSICETLFIILRLYIPVTG